MRVLLIQPDYPKNFRYGPKTDINMAPLGLEYIAAHVQDIAETRLFDNRPHNSKNLEEAIKNFKPHYVGINCNYSFQIYHVNYIAKIAKDHGATTVVGGWHPTVATDDTFTSPWIDIIVRSEGELTFRNLIKKNSPIGIKGLSYKNNGRVIHNPNRELIDLNKLRFPARFLSPKARRAKYTFFGIPTVSMETSRGCPFNCKFCCIHNFYHHKYRVRSVPHIMAELRQIQKISKSVHVVDDNFMVYPDHVMDLCKNIMQEQLNMIFQTSARVDSVLKYPKVFEMMAKAGFFALLLGLESFSNKTLKNLNKRFKFQEIKAGIRKLHDLGFIIQGNIILGSDVNDTIEDLESTIELTKALELDLPTFSIMVPYPKTELGEALEEQGLIMAKDWRDYTWFSPIIKYTHLAPETLREYLNKAYAEVSYKTNPVARFIQLARARGVGFFASRFTSLGFYRMLFASISNTVHHLVNKGKRGNRGNRENRWNRG